MLTGNHAGMILPKPLPMLPRWLRYADQARIFGKGSRRGQIFGLVLLPQSVGAAESGDAALGGDAGSGEDYNGRCGLQPVTSFFHDNYSVARSAATPFGGTAIMG